MQIALFGDGSFSHACLSSFIKQQLAEATVSEAANTHEVLKWASGVEANGLVIWTALSPSNEGLAAMRDVVGALPANVRLVVHGDCGNGIDPGSLREMGVAGIISSCVTTDVAVAILRLITAGGTYFPSPRTSGTGRKSPESLSRRETDVFELLSDGLSNRQIAQHLGLAEATVKIHVHNVLKKLKVKNRIQAARYARESARVF